MLTVTSATAAQRRWTVRDSIELSVFLRSGRQYGLSPRVRFSPNGRHFVAATMRGDLASNKRIATIWLFDTQQVGTYLRNGDKHTFDGAKVLLRTGSTSNRDPISGWRWSADSRSVLYLAVGYDGTRRLYRTNVEGGTPIALSRSDQDVSRFDENNGVIVYLAHKPVSASDLYQAAGPSLPDIVEATGKNVLPLMFPNWAGVAFQNTTDELWRVDNGKPELVLSSDHKTGLKFKDSKLSLSPDGSKLLVTTFTYRIPISWERYKPLIDYPGSQIVADTPKTVGSTGHSRPQQYSLVDISTGSISILADSPIDPMMGGKDFVTAAWSEDGTRVALPGIYPPLADAPASGPIYPCTIGVVEIKNRAFSCLHRQVPIDVAKHPYRSREQIVFLQWRNHGSELVVQFATPNAPNRIHTTTYIRDGRGKWTVTKSRVPESARQFTVEVKQALDRPPVLTASDRQGHYRSILDPNPQLKNITRGTAALYHWYDADGNLWTGALIKPPDFKPGHRYPLVIQTHGLDRAEFFVDGPSASGFAARALAAHNILVLQVDEISKNIGTLEESETGAAGYRSAIKQLTQDGLIDPNKVGVITWSHMGPYVYQALEDQPSLYKAATITEADSNSYPEYLQNIDYMGTKREKMFRAQMGGKKPFGRGLQAWIRNSPGFHFDRICTPILFEINEPTSLLYNWDDYAALRAQDKPVDLLYIRNGNHKLVKPLERLAEQGRNVDWYDYWLNGHKDSDPAKAVQYKLWDHMKANLPVCPKDWPGIH